MPLPVLAIDCHQLHDDVGNHLTTGIPDCPRLAIDLEGLSIEANSIEMSDSGSRWEPCLPLGLGGVTVEQIFSGCDLLDETKRIGRIAITRRLVIAVFIFCGRLDRLNRDRLIKKRPQAHLTEEIEEEVAVRR